MGTPAAVLCRCVGECVMWLTAKEVENLTRRKRPSAQAQVLKDAGIPFRLVAGRPIVVEKDLHAPDHRYPRVRKL